MSLIVNLDGFGGSPRPVNSGVRHQQKRVLKYEMFTRMSDFGATHAASFPQTSPGGEMFAAVNRSKLL